MLKNLIIRKLSAWIRPVMLGGYRNHAGEYLKNVRIGSTSCLVQQEKLKLGDHVYIGHYNFLDASNHLWIAEGCQVTSFVSILTHSSHIAIRLYGRAYVQVPADQKIAYQRAGVEIGAYTFIGPHVVIMPGTKIGKGCIVSAFSYVDGEFPDFSVIAGQPAKVIKDTRQLDAPFLEQHPELKNHYRNWSEQDI